MTPGYAIVWRQAKIFYLSKRSEWSLNPDDAQVFATLAIAKSRSRAFRGAVVVEAWIE